MRQLQEVIPNLWTLDVSAPEVQVRAVVVLGENQAVVWDTLTRPGDMAALESLLADRPFHVVYSHGDWDHVWGTAGFSRSPLDIIAHSDCLRRFADDVPQTLLQKQLAELGRWDDVALLPPNISFASRLSLDLGGLTLELHHLPGHTPDCIVGWIPEWGVLLGGDAIETPLPVCNRFDLLSDWLAALEAWRDNDGLRLAIPSHGSLRGRESLDTTIAYLRAILGLGEFDLPPNLDEFYAATHQANLKLVAGGQAPHA